MLESIQNEHTVFLMCQILQNCHVAAAQISGRWSTRTFVAAVAVLQRALAFSFCELSPFWQVLCLVITLISQQLSQCCPLFSPYKCFLLTKGFSFLLIMHLVMHGDPHIFRPWSLELLMKIIHKSHLVQIALPDVSKI